MKQIKILIAEDESIVAVDLENTLGSLGYQVPAIATSGEETIEKTAAYEPDLVLIDVKLGGGVDGVAAAEIIGSRFKIPVVFLVAYPDEETLKRAGTARPAGYVPKPFTLYELHDAIESALRAQENGTA